MCVCVCIRVVYVFACVLCTCKCRMVWVCVCIESCVCMLQVSRPSIVKSTGGHAQGDLHCSLNLLNPDTTIRSLSTQTSRAPLLPSGPSPSCKTRVHSCKALPSSLQCLSPSLLPPVCLFPSLLPPPFPPPSSMRSMVSPVLPTISHLNRSTRCSGFIDSDAMVFADSSQVLTTWAPCHGEQLK